VNGKTLEVRVPKGVRPGQAIRLARQGAQGGDPYLELEYAAHPPLAVRARNTSHVLPVPPPAAAPGGPATRPAQRGPAAPAAPGGPAELESPAASEAGRKLRLRGRGLPGTPAGDQIVELEVLAPQATTEAQRKAYAALRDAFGSDWKRA